MLARNPPRARLCRIASAHRLEAFLVLRRATRSSSGGGSAYEQEILAGNFLGRRQVMVNAPDAIRQILVTNADNYRRNATSRRVLQPVLGSGLFLAEGDALAPPAADHCPGPRPAHTCRSCARHVVAASAAAEARLATLQHRPVELLPHMQHLALAIAGQSMFSLEMGGYANDLRTMLLGYGRQYAPARSARPSPSAAIFLRPGTRGRAQFRTRWLAFLDRLIADRTAQASDPDRPRDLFDLLSTARDPETGSAFDHAQLRDEVATMILAGHETTAVTLFWALYLAALYPEQQALLAGEAAAANLAEDDASQARLPLIRAHIDEALRLYPPAFLIVRQAARRPTS